MWVAKHRERTLPCEAIQTYLERKCGPAFSVCWAAATFPTHRFTPKRRGGAKHWPSGWRARRIRLFGRVMMNRVWQYHFGQGLLKTPSDFGVRAGQPSHPELLDWLATEFSERKWSLKAMHKLMMTSQAYRRGSAAPEAARQQDPANALLSHMSRRRLQAEEIRDSVLQVSGALNLKAGGMPVVPPLEAEELFGLIGKPENAWVVSDNVEDHYRRSIYLLARRTFQQPMFEAFDSPDGILVLFTAEREHNRASITGASE